MINLIPPQARKNIVSEYWVRVATVGFSMLGSIVFLTVIFMLPSYVLVNLQLRAIAESVVVANSSTENYQDLTTAIIETNKRADLLVAQSENADLTAFITLIDELTSAAIDIQQVKISQTKNGVPQPITLVGTADTRAELANFKDRLELHPEFAAVDLPISNLAQDVDVDFSVTVTLTGSEETDV